MNESSDAPITPGDPGAARSSILDSFSPIHSQYFVATYALDVSACRGVVPNMALVLGQGYQELAISPLTPGGQLSQGVAQFVADCFSYFHETPVLLKPREAGLLGSTTLLEQATPPVGVRDAESAFIEGLDTILEVASENRWGPSFNPVMRWDDMLGCPAASGFADASLIELSTLEPASDLLALYAASTRQPDPFAEYLFLWRVLEHASDGTGVDWIAGHLPGIEHAEIGSVWCSSISGPSSVAVVSELDALVQLADAQLHDGTVLEFTGVMRAAAIKRRDALLDQHDGVEEAAGHLYSERRCGIAHAKRSRTYLNHGLNDDLASVLEDIPLLRVLARAAISEVSSVG